MNKADLEKMTKEELIEAIARVERQKYPYFGKLTQDILDAISQIRREKIFRDANEARDESVKAMNAYFDWQRRVIRDYGDGQTVKVLDIPENVIAEGSKLNEAWNKAEEKRKQAEKAEDDYYRRLLK